MFFKIIARMTELYFYFCIFLGFITSSLIIFTLLLNAWNKFVASKNTFCEWLKTYSLCCYIQKHYKLALLSETTFKTALEYIDSEEKRKELWEQWKDLRDAE